MVWNRAETEKITDKHAPLKQTGMRFTLKDIAIKTYDDTSDGLKEILISDDDRIISYLEKAEIIHVDIRSDDLVKESFASDICTAKIAFIDDAGKTYEHSLKTDLDAEMTFDEEYWMQEDFEYDAQQEEHEMYDDFEYDTLQEEREMYDD